MQTAKRVRDALAMTSPLARSACADFLPADTVGLVPVKLSPPNSTVRQTDRSDPLHLAPAPATVGLAKATELADAAADGDRFHISDVTDDLEPPPRHRGGYAMRASGTLTDRRLS